MAKTNSAEFTKDTKLRLAARVGHVCSFPGCPQATSGPGAAGNSATVNLGEACHICGAAPGSPRYDPSMTDVERKSIENGIWLCSTHHNLIDSDPTTYKVKNLYQLKQQAEARAAERLRTASPATLKASGLYGTPRTPSGKFVGREEEISQLRERLQHSTSVRVAASVEGLPGIGKTELALQLVYRLARDEAFPGGIFWFDAEDPDLVPAWGGEIAEALGVPPGPVEERTAHALRSVGENPAPALLVLDNVETWGAGKQPGPLPQGGNFRLLVTTRQRHLGGGQFDEHVEVGFLDAEFARQLLETVSGRELAAAPGFEELVEHLGGHALAVELAGAFLGAYRSETPESYLAELQAGVEIEAEASELVRYGATVSQAFKALWDRQDEETRAAWRLAACFEPEPVTAELSEAVGLTGRSFRQLERLHLVEVAAEGGWWMHRLTREFGQWAGTEDELAAAQVVFVEGCAEFAERIELADGFRPYLSNRSHLDAALRLAPEVLDSQDPRFSSFSDKIATGLQSAGDLRRARKLFEQALAWGLASLGEDDPKVAASRSNLAVVLRNLGDLEGAKELLELALASNLSNLGEAHPAVALRRSNLAVVLQDLGDLEGAKDLLELALASDLENLGEDHPSVAIRRGILAGVLQALNDLEGAEELLRLTIVSLQATLGEDHPYVTVCRSRLALVRQDLGDLEGAKVLLDKVLASELATLGEDHPSMVTSRSNLAVVLQELGDLEGAKRMQEEALASALANLGEDHPTVATSRSSLAVVLGNLGDLEGAKVLLEQALASDLENLGEDHPEVAKKRSNLAVVLWNLRELPAARAMAKEALRGAALQPEGSLARSKVEAALRGLLATETEE